MRAWGAVRAAALLALFATPLCAKKEGPNFQVSQFKAFPDNLSYFANSDVILFQDKSTNTVYRSEDAGATWKRVEGVPDGEAYVLYMHFYDPERAYILTAGTEHYRTHDRGKTWDKFQTEAEMSLEQGDFLHFHADIPDRIIFNGAVCKSIFCEEVAMYTTDGFRTPAKLLRPNTAGCWWAKSRPIFTTGDEAKDKDRTLCVARDPFSLTRHDRRLYISDTFFAEAGEKGKLEEMEPNLDTNKPVKGVVNVAAVQKFLLVATSSPNTDELALYVTDDTIKWHRAMFPADHRVDEDAYTVLESTEYSIQVDVQTTYSNPMGVMFTSNSNGTYFTRNFEHTNRNARGWVDFEKISNIQGIFLLNSVKNWEEAEKSRGVAKKKITEISFDDGRTFEDVTADGKRVHLHSVTELSNTGRVFSSPAPGLVMGIGNTGDYLEDYWDGSLFVSDDAGKTWIKGLDGPHKYEFGDQGSILVAVRDSQEAEVSEIKYSLDHGQSWLTAALPDDLRIRPWFLTTTQDATSLKFVLVGEGKGKEPYQVVSIDFDGLHEDTCKKSDLEDWFARVGEDGKPTCLMGHKQKFQRRKKNAECFMKAEHKELVIETEDCECTDADFECDYNFVRDGDGKCITKIPIIPPEEACKDGKPEDTFLGPSGYRLIPGNTCKRKSGKQLDDKVERKCSEAKTPDNTPATGEVDVNQHVFEGHWSGFDFIKNLERGDSSSADDETIFVRTKKGSDYSPFMLTKNHGKEWEEIKDVPSNKVEHVYQHRYYKEMVFFVGKKEKVYYTPDRGQSFSHFDAPYPPRTDGWSPLVFHPDQKNWMIWIGQKCERNDKCHLEASLSEDRGDHWKTISRNVRRCAFTGSHEYNKYRNGKTKQIICSERPEGDNDGRLQLVTSNDFFDEHHEVVQKRVIDFATMAEFIVVATADPQTDSIQAQSSLDGTHYAPAQWPYNFNAPQKHAFTVLDSSTHAVNMMVVTEFGERGNWGSIMKSNSNGTNYVQSISGVNCNEDYYVDFEKMQGLEGVAMVNIVANQEEKKGPKKLQTKITHNDGAEWAYLPPPKTDVDGKPFSCTSSKANKNQGDEKCGLHLHGFTERSNREETFSTAGAVGLMFGWGNVGSALGDSKDADTYMTTDAGITWKQVQKGRWTWAMGDQGSIIVLVQKYEESKSKTSYVYYSVDEGANWKKKEFSEDEVEVHGLNTMRSGGSRNFLIYGRNGNNDVFSATLDFSKLSDRQCEHDEKNAADSDYYLWSPKHPLQDNDCFWGHVSQYLRKKPEKTCYNPFRMNHLYNLQNCTCTRQDYEW